ncbi:phosphatase [Jannaschia pagri]|uniref:phosphoglycolate phosphatase n=1 Tax=Jannaschia pagri TaxID=2829797 RepID=A0ABQ4NG33_9RHOB|nr:MULTISPECIES: HAD family hydrolase [unclassified Jannaschia]GIT90514.1 phosphatase [Jannaschia sp. AI_61]GIT93381.1 phosphatase [Jannaschia sp. AI_62]
MYRAILFDKDGTLTDFRKTWEAWLPGFIGGMAEQAGLAPERLADIIGFDLDLGVIRADGAFVTGTSAQMGQALAQETGWSTQQLVQWWDAKVIEVTQVPVLDLAPFLAGLRGRGLLLGILTNADEAEARTHLAAMGVLDAFDQVIGYDSGWGPKPTPDGALAFARTQGLAPSEVLVVGDGMTDMGAAHGAGMDAVAVLTGTLDREALSPHAVAVLDSIADLPHWLSERVPS